MKRQPVPQAPPKQIHSQMVFVSTSRVDQQHRTTIFTDGTAHCTCEHFQYHQACRHTDALRRPYTVADFAGGHAIALELQ
jgi:hypothetical protein